MTRVHSFSLTPSNSRVDNEIFSTAHFRVFLSRHFIVREIWLHFQVRRLCLSVTCSLKIEESHDKKTKDGTDDPERV